MQLIEIIAKRLNVPLYELLGGLVRHKCQVYCWIGGDRPSDIEAAASVVCSLLFAQVTLTMSQEEEKRARSHLREDERHRRRQLA